MATKKEYILPECSSVELVTLSICDPSGYIEPGGNEDIGYEDWN